MYLLDTDILSNIAKRTPSTAPVAKLALVPQEAQFTSSITLGEMVYGAYKLQTHTPTFFWISWKRHYCLICRCSRSMETQRVVTAR